MGYLSVRSFRPIQYSLLEEKLTAQEASQLLFVEKCSSLTLLSSLCSFSSCSRLRSFLCSSISILLCFSKTISVKVIDDEEYEKNKTFFLEIGEPRLVEMSEKKGGGAARAEPNSFCWPVPPLDACTLQNVTYNTHIPPPM